MPKHPHYHLDVEQACEVIDSWIEREHLYDWADTPGNVQQNLRDAAVDGRIEFHHATRILKAAETNKISALANRGMQSIRQQWRDMKRLTLYFLKAGTPEWNVALKKARRVIVKQREARACGWTRQLPLNEQKLDKILPSCRTPPACLG